MQAGTLLEVIADIILAMKAKGLIKDDGAVVVNTVQEVADLVTIVEQALKSHGALIPEKVDKIIAALPMLMAVFS